MYVTLLLLAPAVCEWVEISQQHYSRKPVRAHHFQTSGSAGDYADETNVDIFQTPFKKPNRLHKLPIRDYVTESYEEETTYFKKPIRTQYFPADGVTEVYMEDSIQDSRYRYKKPTPNQILNIDRMTEDYKEIKSLNKTTHLHSPVNENLEDYKKQNRIYLNQSVGTTAWNTGNINKVPKHGNVQRVQLDNNAVKAPNFKTNLSRNSVNKGFVNGETHKEDTDFSEFDENSEGGHDIYKETRKPYNNRLKSKINAEEYVNHGLKNLDMTDINLKNQMNSNKLKDNYTLGINFSDNPNLIFGTTEVAFASENTNVEIIENTNFQKKLYKPLSGIPPLKVTNVVENPELPFEVNNTAKNTNKDADNRKIKIKKPLDNINSRHDANQIPKEETLDSVGEEDQTRTEPSSDSNMKTMENLMNLMRVVADTIRRNTRKSVNSKTKYLTALKNTLLSSIKERIDITWPDDPPVGAGTNPRVTRAAQATARGHLEIPSSESALMTISFLTFAVFLIKLVLQIIQAYKNKTMMVTPAVVATVGRAAAAATKRSSIP